MKYSTLFLFIFALAMPFFVRAQIIPSDVQSLFGTNPSQFDMGGLEQSLLTTQSDAIDEQLSVEMTPQNARPGEDVAIRVSSFSTDLNKAKITWRVNSTIVLQQIGATNFTFTMGKIGEAKSITITVEKNDGGVIEKTYFMVPAEMDLVYEPITYTPPFYKGRAWPTHQSTIKVLALPRIYNDFDALIPADTYTYTWKVDGRVIQDSSGYGKNTLQYTSGLLDDTTKISVEASPVNSNVTVSGVLNITPVEPLLVMYEQNPLYGTIFEQAVRDTFFLNRNEITFETVPYFFSTPNLDYTWIMNGNQIANTGNPRQITFRIENEESGRANISVRANNNDKILQSASESATLLFEKMQNDAPLPF